MVGCQFLLILAAVIMQDYGEQLGPKLIKNTINIIKLTSNRSVKT